MHNHFDQYLNLQQHLLAIRPQHIVECGAGTGELTLKIAALRDRWGFDYTVINDRQLEVPKWIQVIRGVSYVVLAALPTASIDFCIIDTDHNYWTLMKELTVLDAKLTPEGYIALHDVATFYSDTGMALNYDDLLAYPRSEIEPMAYTHGGLGNALMDFLSQKRFDYHLVEFTSASHGAALMQKTVLSQVSVSVPGPKAVYA